VKDPHDGVAGTMKLLAAYANLQHLYNSKIVPLSWLFLGGWMVLDAVTVIVSLSRDVRRKIMVHINVYFVGIS
jgi:hypothetical protein